MDLLGDLGARTVASARSGARAFCRRAALFGLLPLALAACWAPPENSVHRAARERRLADLQGQADELARRRQQLTDAIAEDVAAQQTLRDESALAASRRRIAARALELELDQLTALEQDLAAAKARAAAAAAEFEPLRTAERDVQDRQQRLQQLQQQARDLEPQLATALQELAAIEARVLPQLEAVNARLARVKEFDAALQQAAAALQAAAQAAAPAPPAPAPAAAPAATEKKL